MAAERQVIRLEVRLEGDAPTGSAHRDDGTSREFTGWMTLVAAIEQLLTGGGDRVVDRRPAN